MLEQLASEREDFETGVLRPALSRLFAQLAAPGRAAAAI